MAKFEMVFFSKMTLYINDLCKASCTNQVAIT